MPRALLETAQLVGSGSSPPHSSILKERFRGPTSERELVGLEESSLFTELNMLLFRLETQLKDLLERLLLSLLTFPLGMGRPPPLAPGSLPAEPGPWGIFLCSDQSLPLLLKGLGNT